MTPERSFQVVSLLPLLPTEMPTHHCLRKGQPLVQLADTDVSHLDDEVQTLQLPFPELAEATMLLGAKAQGVGSQAKARGPIAYPLASPILAVLPGPALSPPPGGGAQAPANAAYSYDLRRTLLPASSGLGRPQAVW